jgi:hypothetical protein
VVRPKRPDAILPTLAKLDNFCPANESKRFTSKSTKDAQSSPAARVLRAGQFHWKTLPKVSKHFRQGFQKVPKTSNFPPIPPIKFKRKPRPFKRLTNKLGAESCKNSSRRRAARCRGSNRQARVVLPSMRNPQGRFEGSGQGRPPLRLQEHNANMMLLSRDTCQGGPRARLCRRAGGPQGLALSSSHRDT